MDREANSVVEWLANNVHTLSRVIVEYSDCPPNCVARAITDISGVCLTRLVSS